MRKLLIALVVFCGSVFAQTPQVVYPISSTAQLPSSCAGSAVAWLLSPTGVLYTCQSGTPAIAAGPGAAVTSVATGCGLTGGPITGTGTLVGTAACETIANASSTGTTLNKLAKLTGAPSTVVVSGAGDTGGAIGIVDSGAGTTGSAVVQENGQHGCVFDGATTAGHYVQISASVAGDCTDAGATYPASGQVIGVVLSTNGSGGTYTVDMSLKQASASSGGGGSAVYCAAAMSMGNLTCTPSPAITSYTAGLVVYFTSSASNSGATTIQISGLASPKNIFLNGSALSGTHFSSTTVVYSAVYDGTQFNVEPGDLTNGTTATTQTCGDATTDVATDQLVNGCGVNVLTRATGVTLSAAQLSAKNYITNAGSSGTIVLTLGTGQCTVGEIFSAYVVANHAITLTPFTGDQLMVWTASPSTSLTSDTVTGSFISFACLVAGQWYPLGANGSWM